MKIDSGVFNTFLDAINIVGDDSITIKDCIFRGTTDKLTVTAVIPSKTIIIRAELKGDFSSIGDIGIDNLQLLKKVLSTCKGEIDITKTTNKLKIMSGKKLKVELGLRNTQYILNELDKAKFDILLTKASGNAFTLDKASLDELKKYYAVFGKELFINGDENNIEITMDNGENSLALNLEVPESVKKFEVKLAGLAMKIFGLISTDKVTMSVNDGATVVVVNAKTGEQEVNYLAAPMVK